MNEKELHFMEFIPMENGMMDANSPYYEYFKRAKKNYEDMHEVEYQ